MFDAYDDWQKDDFLARYRVPAEGDDLAKHLTQRIIQTSWGAFGGKLDAVTIAAGIEMASKYDGIQLRREHIYQKPDVPVEGVALPQLDPSPKNVASAKDWVAILPHDSKSLQIALLSAEESRLEREDQLREAISQRDAARADRDMTQVSFGKILLEANQWKDRTTKAEELLREHKTTYDLNLAILQRNHEIDRAEWEPVLIERVRVAEAALTAMTEDRNLWQNAHDEDCPNKAALATERKDKAQLQYALEQSESKFPTERARVLQDLKRAMIGGSMSFLAVPLFVFLMWPFHRHHVPAPQPPVVYIVLPPGEPVVPEKACTHDAAFGWELRGPDGATGYSQTSCQEAFEDWEKQPANNKPVDRS